MALGIHRDRTKAIMIGLSQYEADNGSLPGLQNDRWRECLVEQIVSSLRRIEYIHQLLYRNVDAERCNPHSALFDPLRASIYLHRQGLIDEAVWMTFVGTHFGKHAVDGWKLAANVFGSFGQGPIWTLEAYSSSPETFEEMLGNNKVALEDKSNSGRFSNHRKFQSKKPDRIGETFRTYFDWQMSVGGFRERLIQVHKARGQAPTETFDGLYHSMHSVYGFGGGRLGRFDFLTMLWKLGLAPIEPGSVYLSGATGPLQGAKLLFFGDRDYPISGGKLQANVDGIDDYLNVGKQALEDSICNWQKSPGRFVYFRG